jgi:hypothetical protein
MWEIVENPTGSPFGGPLLYLIAKSTTGEDIIFARQEYGTAVLYEPPGFTSTGPDTKVIVTLGSRTWEMLGHSMKRGQRTIEITKCVDDLLESIVEAAVPSEVVFAAAGCGEVSLPLVEGHNMGTFLAMPT